MNSRLFRCAALGGMLLALSAALGEVQPTNPDPDYPIVLKEPEDPGPVSVKVEKLSDTKGKAFIKVSAKGQTDVKNYAGAVKARAFQGTVSYAVTELTPHGKYYVGEIEAPCGADPVNYPSFSIRLSVDYKDVGIKTAEFKSFKGVAVP